MLIIIVMITGCSGFENRISDYEARVKVIEDDKESLQKEIEDLKKVNQSLRNINQELSNSIKEANNENYFGGLLYHEIEEDEYVRFVSQRVELLALPYEGAPKIRMIEDNTLVTVYDKVSVENDIEKGAFWYYVAIPVYDTPMDYKGWIRVNDTIDYNEETRDILQSDVYICKGSRVIESYDFPTIEDDVGYIINYELRGRLEDRKNGYVRLDCPGGMSCWVKQEDIIYPKLP